MKLKQTLLGKLALATVVVAGFSTQAEHRDHHRHGGDAQRVLRAEANRLIDITYDRRVSPEKLRTAISLIRQAQDTLLDRSSRRACALNDDIDTLREASKLVRAFAYASNGLNKSSSGATEYARNWIQNYPCSAAEDFVREGKKIRTYAYASNGLNLSSSGAANYAEQMTPQLCELGVDLQAKATQLYRYAYATDGLNMSSSGASNYAKEQMKKRYFGCQGGGVYKYGPRRH